MNQRRTRSQRGIGAPEPEPEPAAVPAKRGRGRPRGSKNKPADTEDGSGATAAHKAVPEAVPEDAPVEAPVKRGRGRPRGSKNKPKSEVPLAARQPDPEPEAPARRGRGRPPGSTNKSPRVQTLLTFSSPRTGPPRKPRTARASEKVSDELEPASEQDDNDDDGEDSTGTAGTGFSEDPAERSRPKRPRTAGAPSAAPATPKAGAPRGYKWREWTPKRVKKADMWAGPQRDQPRINAGYIDIGLDVSTWAALRGMRVDWERIEIERPQHAEDGAVYMTLADSSGARVDEGQPLRIPPLEAQPLAGQTPGWIANAAELVMAVDWAPVQPADAAADNVDYIAIGGLGAGSAAAAMEPVLGRRVRSPRPGHIQVWRLEVDPQSQASDVRLDMAIQHSFGHCTALRWCPIGVQRGAGDSAGVPAIGVLAAAFGDGMLRVCAVPVPDALRQRQTDTSASSDMQLESGVEPVCIRWPQQSLMEVRAGQGVFTSVEWASSDVLVAGTSRGVLQAWHIGSAVQSPSSTAGAAAPATMVSQQLHEGPILTIGVYHLGTAPGQSFDDDRSADGFRQIGIADIQLVTLGVDGRLRQTPLLFPTRLGVPLQNLSRLTPACCPYWPLGTCIFSDVDKTLRMTNSSVLADPGDPWLQAMARPDSTGSVAGDGEDESAKWNQMFDRSARLLMALECPTQQVVASDLHTYVAVAKSSGELVIGNMEHGSVSRKFVSQSRVIYTLLGDPFDAQGSGADGGRAAGQRRFVCCGRQAPQVRAKTDMKKSERFRVYVPEVAVRVCAWSRNPRTGTWIASATASGVVRIEDVAR